MYFPYKFIGRRGIRRTFAVIFVRLAYIMENDVPCFVRHMAEKIFFLYLTGFQHFDCPVCRSFGLSFPKQIYPGYFISKLETVDGISWDGAWRTTEAGQRMRALLA